MALSPVQELFEEQIKPHLFLVKKMLEENRSSREICETLQIEMGIWRLCKRKCNELVEVIEEVHGHNSAFYEKVLPFFDDIEKWMIEGFTLPQIQEKLGMRGKSFHIYRKIYPFFDEFLNECKEKMNCRVKNSVYKRANGYQFEEKKESIEEGEYLYDSNGREIYETNPDGSLKMKDGKPVHKRKKGKIKMERVTKELAPDVSAATLYLANESNWTRRDQETDDDPIQTAELIKNYLSEMEEKVPSTPVMTTTERVLDLLSKMNKKELSSLVPVIQRVVEDVNV